GERGVIQAGVVVNATGPWTDRLRALEHPGTPPLLRVTKGVHLVVPRTRLGLHSAVTFASRVDGRVMFALPWGAHAYIGTTDTDSAESPDDVSASGDDLVYLLRSANAQFPGAHLTFADVRATWAGLRPLVGGKTRGESADDVSREHVVSRGIGGMITVAGGKLTTYRLMAADAVDRAVKELRDRGYKQNPSRPPTDMEPLIGGEVADLAPFRERGLEAGLGPGTVEHLLRHYGTEAAGIYNLGLQDRRLFRRLHPDHPSVEAEVIHAARRELAQTVEDVLVRRIHLFYETADHGVRAAQRVAELLGRELGWNEERVGAEAAAYDRLVEGSR
ncbi:MAG TPA: FAD-dependent oxidoreductase, partial [Gemmatimonadales bacterium]|nr:FAD-dependent oxidoreductase [Gemmatimonadales bacterium]